MPVPYFENFFLNFIFSFIFLITNFICSISINNFLNNRNVLAIGYFTVFACIIATYAIIFNLLIIFNLINFSKIVFYFLFILQLFFSFNSRSFILIGEELKFLKTKKFFLILVPLFLISILPISDADSIAIHLNIPNEVLSTGKLNINLSKNIESLLYSSTEAILIISNFLGSDNFGSQLNFFSLVIFFLANKNKDNFWYIVLSSPLIIFLISTQKLQLFYSLIFLQTFILIKQKIEKKNNIFIILFLIFFYITGKLNYLLFGFVLYLFLILNFKKHFFNIVVYSIFFFLIITSPFLLIKFLSYGNPVSPFWDQLFQKNEIFMAFENSIRSTEGWLNSGLSIKKLLQPILPLNLHQLSTSFGLLFLFILFNLKLHKITFFIPIILMFLILINGQLLPRYYLEAFLILAYFFNLNGTLKKLCIFQSSFIFIFSVIFLLKSYNNLIISNFNKKLYQKNFSYSYNNSLKLKAIANNKNILVEDLDRDSLFFNHNIYSFRYLNILKNNSRQYHKINFNDKLVNYIIDNKILLYVSRKKISNISCIKMKNIGKIRLTKVTRNFLIKFPEIDNNIYEVNYENCKK